MALSEGVRTSGGARGTRGDCDLPPKVPLDSHYPLQTPTLGDFQPPGVVPSPGERASVDALSRLSCFNPSRTLRASGLGRLRYPQAPLQTPIYFLKMSTLDAENQTGTTSSFVVPAFDVY